MTENQTTEYPRMNAAYKRYPELVLDELNPLELAMTFEMAVMMNTVYEQPSFVHKMLLQAAHALRAPSPERAEPVSVEDLRAALDRICEHVGAPQYPATHQDMRDIKAIRAVLSQQQRPKDAVKEMALEALRLQHQHDSSNFRDDADCRKSLRGVKRARQKALKAAWANGPPVRFRKEVEAAAERCRQERITRKAAQEQGGGQC